MPRGILLDIEGTTSSISFVHDTMFPFVLDRLERFLDEHFAEPEVQNAGGQIATDAGFESLQQWSEATGKEPRQLVVDQVRELMAIDAKATGLKALQGLIWKDGFAAGELKAHVFPDVIPCIRRWRELGIDVRIYSSGSIQAQKLFFGHLEGQANCLDLLSGHYDTTIGSKKEVDSYRRILEDWGLAAGDVVFVSDVAAELEAASQVSIIAVASVRPGNPPLPEDFSLPRINSFEQLLDSSGKLAV